MQARAPISFGTARLKLRSWRQTDCDAFAALHADPAVMADMGGPFPRAQSDAKLDRYIAAFEEFGYCRWALETAKGDFIGYTGLMPHGPEHPLGTHADIGWRLMRAEWGQGYVMEAAHKALQDAFSRIGLAEVFAYTAPDNSRSMAVMTRLELERQPIRDFTLPAGWHGLVWRTGPERFGGP